MGSGDSQNVRCNLTYWFPILLPILIGLLLPLLQLQSNLQESSTLKEIAKQASRSSKESKKVEKIIKKAKQAALANQIDKETTQHLNDKLSEYLGDNSDYVTLQNGELKIDKDLIENASKKMAENHYTEFLFFDVRRFAYDATRSIAVSIITVDVWALTTLLTVSTVTRASILYAYPLVGMFLHIIFLILYSTISDPDSNWALGAEGLITILALLVGWKVRDVIWKYHDSLSLNQKNKTGELETE